MNQSESIGSLALALSKAQGQFGGAIKSSENPFYKSKYADLHGCIEATKGPLSENELAVIQTTQTEENGVLIITTLAHSSGEWIRGTILMTPKKDDDQSRGSSITYGRRYCYAAIVGLAQKDDDGNEASTAPPKPKVKPKSLAWYLKDAEKNNEAEDVLTAWYKDHEQEINALTEKDRGTLLAKLGEYKSSLRAESKPEPEDRVAVDQWLKWISGFSKVPLDRYQAAYETKLEPSLDNFSEDHKNELIIAHRDMVNKLSATPPEE